MPFNTTVANDILKLLLTGVEFDGIAQNDTTGPLANLYFAFHTADPGPAGTQATSELAYGEYARKAVARSPAAWNIVNNVANPAAAAEFPEMLTGAGGIITFVSIGLLLTGAGKIIARGPFTPNIPVVAGVTPRVKVDTAFTLVTAS